MGPPSTSLHLEDLEGEALFMYPAAPDTVLLAGEGLVHDGGIPP